jgi:hypothetical protein
MNHAYALSLANLQWPALVRLIDRFRIQRLIDVRSVDDAQKRFSRASLESAYGSGYEQWGSLSPFQSFEREIVRGELKKLVDSAGAARMCLLHNGARCHLTELMGGFGWRTLSIAADGRLTEESPRERRGAPRPATVFARP